MTVNQLAREISDMVIKRNPNAEHFQINKDSKLSLTQSKTSKRYTVYLLRKGQKSKQIRYFEPDEHARARQYCLDKVKALSEGGIKYKKRPRKVEKDKRQPRKGTKVTLVSLEENPITPSELDDYRYNKLGFIKEAVRTQSTIVKESILDLIDILLQHHQTLSNLENRVERLERE